MANSNEYMRQYMSDRRLNRRNKLIEMSGGKCKECDSSENLEFNHINRQDKNFILSGFNLDKPWALIIEEHSKCELLCSNHHKEYTRTQWQNGELAAWNKDLHGDYKHGSPRTYHELKCRCEKCKLAKRMYREGKIKNHEVLHDC